MEKKSFKISIEEANKLIQYLDLVLKQTGIVEAKNVIYFSDKISALFKEEENVETK